MIAISIKVVLGLSHVESPRCEGVVAVAFGGTTVGLNLNSSNGGVIVRGGMICVLWQCIGIRVWHSHGESQAAQNQKDHKFHAASNTSKG